MADSLVTEFVCKNGMMFLARGTREQLIERLTKVPLDDFVEIELISCKTEEPTMYSVRPEEVFLVGNTREHEDFETVEVVKNKAGEEVPLVWPKNDTVH